MPTLNQIYLNVLKENIDTKDVRRALRFKTPSSKAVTLAYKVLLQRKQTYINLKTREAIEPLTKAILRSDAKDDPIEALFRGILLMMSEAINDPMFLNNIWNIAQKESHVNFKKYDKGLYKQININGIPVSLEQDIINNWVKSNVGLITKTNSNQALALENLFRDNAYSGVRAKELHEGINKIFKGTRNNVALIARDQVAKLGGQLDMVKQTNAGIPGYYWRTARGERVRMKHALREGKYFSWDKPPPGGHPGFEFQCRCDAEPAVDKVLLSHKEWKEERASLSAENAELRKQAVTKAKAGPLKKKK